jgi:hypothetical protein
MMDLRKLYPDLKLNTGANEAQINTLTQETPDIPAEYCDFLAQSNGALGFIGKSYIQLWSIDEIFQSNDGYKAKELFPGLLLIGTNGGQEAYVIDLRSESKARYGMIPFITSGFDDLIPCGESLDEFLEFVKNQSKIG